MTLLSVILALMLEQVQAKPAGRLTPDTLKRFITAIERQFNDGQYAHGVLAWGVAVALPCLVLSMLYAGLLWQETILAYLLAVGILYLTIGFRQFSRNFTEIQEDLRNDDIDSARKRLAQWRGVSDERLSSTEVSRLAIETGLVASHHYVFAPVVWFAAIGPAGPVMYRMAQLANEAWGMRHDDDIGRFGEFSRRVFWLIDWIPIRLTAAAFAIVGDFEDAAHCWRTQAEKWPDPSSGILLATGAGALGVRLGLPVGNIVGIDVPLEDRPELGLGDDADADFMQSTTGLVWRTLVLVLLMLALITVSGWVGE
jgi:adenosylcobinamide-phosphate synthase